MIESSVWSGLNVGRRCDASTAMPRNSVPRITATQVRVIAAFRDSGLRNAWMPFEIASTPLNATAPDENARNNRKKEAPVSSACAPVKCSRALWSVGSLPSEPVATPISPATTSSVIMAM